MGSGTTAVAAKALNRNFIGFETDPEYQTQSLERITETANKSDEDLPTFQQMLFDKND